MKGIENKEEEEADRRRRNKGRKEEGREQKIDLKKGG